MNRIIYCMFKEKICPIVDSLAIPIPSQARSLQLHGAAPSIVIMHLLCVAHKEHESDSIKLHWIQHDQVEIIGYFNNNLLELKTYE